MATNFIQPGKTLALNAPYDRTSGTGALVGAIFGVSLGTVLSGVEGQFMVSGVWELAKTSAQAWTQGAPIYWDNTNKRCDNDSSVGPFIGIATVAAANPSSTGIVRLNGTPDEGVPQQFPTVVQAVDGAIAIASGLVKLTKGSAAAMTLAAPTAGQNGTRLIISSGSAFAHVVTATGLIEDGVTGGSKTTMTFAAFPGASIELVAYNLKWTTVSTPKAVTIT